MCRFIFVFPFYNSIPKAYGTEKFVRLVDVPAGFETLIRPVVAPLGTVATKVVDVSTLTADAAWLLNVTLVPELKFEPVIVTNVPTGP